MNNMAEQKCPSCGAPMRFDPGTGKLVCDYCGAVAEITAEQQEESQPQEATLEGFDFTSMSQQAADEQAAPLPIYNCVSCGAEVIAPPEQAALTCPYCSNNIVLTNQVSGKLRPDGVVPFHVDAKQLPDTLTRFYQDKVLLPRNFFSESTMGKVTGVYVPFWVFNGRITGELDFQANTVSVSRQGNYEVTTTSTYGLRRGVDLRFRDVPVDASGRIDDDLMDSLEPFELSDSRPFDMRYLAGFTADRFDQEKDDVAPRAKKRMLSSAERAAAARAGSQYSGAHRTGGSLRADLKARYLLLPVYLFSIRHGGKDYRFAVNGQSGKVVGEVPTDKGVCVRYFLLRCGAVAGAIMAALVVRYMLGG